MPGACNGDEARRNSAPGKPRRIILCLRRKGIVVDCAGDHDHLGRRRHARNEEIGRQAARPWRAAVLVLPTRDVAWAGDQHRGIDEARPAPDQHAADRSSAGMSDIDHAAGAVVLPSASMAPAVAMFAGV